MKVGPCVQVGLRQMRLARGVWERSGCLEIVSQVILILTGYTHLSQDPDR